MCSHGGVQYVSRTACAINRNFVAINKHRAVCCNPATNVKREFG